MLSAAIIRRSAWVVVALVVIAGLAILLATRLPTAFVPEEDQGYAFALAQLPSAASLDRTDAVALRIENILTNTPGVQYYTTVEGFSLLSQVHSHLQRVLLCDAQAVERTHQAGRAVRGHPALT